jgi:hypothetical protein
MGFCYPGLFPASCCFAATGNDDKSVHHALSDGSNPTTLISRVETSGRSTTHVALSPWWNIIIIINLSAAYHHHHHVSRTTRRGDFMTSYARRPKRIACAYMHLRQAPEKVHIPYAGWYFAFVINPRASLCTLNDDQVAEFESRRKTYVAYVNAVRNTSSTQYKCTQIDNDTL